MNELVQDSKARHKNFGEGTVRSVHGETAIVRFDHGLEECLVDDLTLVDGVADQASNAEMKDAATVTAHVLGEAIQSTNDEWGVFSSSRIALLPHQLWVCKRVLGTWPTRWLIADDVGLGKTVEAGMILTALLARKRIERLLVITPASLARQWQLRIREMFDIRSSLYNPTSDTDDADWWNSHNTVVASIHTLRLDRNKRWDRILEAQPWDLVLVDEAHHLYVEEKKGPTLAYQLLEQMQKRNRIRSLVLFTGTPHRGKEHGFLALLKLLRPDEFDLDAPLRKQAHKLRGVMIRNNKQCVTDMEGNLLFTPVRQHRETYSYSEPEALFYQRLTEFIQSGRAYAAGLGAQKRRVASLVLIAMQKLASSSVAAVRKALMNRLVRLREAKERAQFLDERLVEHFEDDGSIPSEELSALEEELAEYTDGEVLLNPKEIPDLEELIGYANAVVDETKIERIIQIVQDRFPDESVLFFTEYKATQALLFNALQAKFGRGCSEFINGEGVLHGIANEDGSVSSITSERNFAATRFNEGEVRFLVTTEAAGEGIDLQEFCSSLIHVDLPWNPMRLHQRVGRVSRYGQKHPVDVVTVRNLDTVEARIWECLDNKLSQITATYAAAMDEPEDARQLILGMASPREIRELFLAGEHSTEIKSDDPKTRASWFDATSQTFGNQDAVDVVRHIIGNVARFDLASASPQIPRVDVEDLVPFMKLCLSLHGKRATEEGNHTLTFRTPETWSRGPEGWALADQYRICFSRRAEIDSKTDRGGIALKIVQIALEDVHRLSGGMCCLSGIERALAVLAVRDRVTGTEIAKRKLCFGVEKSEDGWRVLRDWELIRHLNPIAQKPRGQSFSATPPQGVNGGELLAEAHDALLQSLPKLDLGMTLPSIENIAVLLPGSSPA